MPYLTVDIGNSYIKCISINSNKDNSYTIIHKATIETKLLNQQNWNNWINNHFKLNNFSATIISCIIPELLNNIIHPFKNTQCNFYIVNHKDCLPYFKTNYQPIKSMGIDRLIGIIGTIHFYSQPAMIVDCGTATTIDFINNSLYHEGGLIIPGLNTTIDAINQKSSQIKEIKLIDNLNLPPSKYLANNTQSCLNLGNYLLHYYGLKQILNNIINQDNLKKKKINIIWTGGLAHYLYNNIKIDNSIQTYDSNFIAKAMLLIYQLITKK